MFKTEIHFKLLKIKITDDILILLKFRSVDISLEPVGGFSKFPWLLEASVKTDHALLFLTLFWMGYPYNGWGKKPPPPPV